MKNEVIIGDCREVLKTLPEKSVHCCVTSPPYFNLRDYGVEGQIGLEQSPEEYVNELVTVFREVKRVLRDDGTLWLNLGDSYNGSGGNHKEHHKNDTGFQGEIGADKYKGRGNRLLTLKPKDLIGIPWRVAFALQADGWYLRQDIIWQKFNPMPESVRDRCTKAHEYIFLLSKSGKYYFDNEAIKEQAVSTNPSGNGFKRSARVSYQNPDGTPRGNDNQWEVREKRNKRSVWQVNTKPYKGAHFATFPPKLIEPCILAGTSEKGVCSECGSPFKRVIEKTGYTEHGGYRKRADAPGAEVSPSSVFRTGLIATTKTVDWKPSCSCNTPSIPATVLDPFAGSGTVGEVCKNIGRNAILIELNPAYAPLIEERAQVNNSSLEAFVK